jgi:hypothetical protein
MGDGTLTITGAGQNTVLVPAFPQEVGIFLAINLAAPAHEWDDEHQLSVRLRHPDMHVIGEQAFPWPEERGVNPEGDPSWDFYMALATFHLIPADADGGYQLEVVVDEHMRAAVPVIIHEMPEPPGE